MWWQSYKSRLLSLIRIFSLKLEAFESRLILLKAVKVLAELLHKISSDSTVLIDQRGKFSTTTTLISKLTLCML